MYSRDTSNSADIIDSRDVIARIKELEDEREVFQEAVDHSPEDAGYKQDLADWDDDYGCELSDLKALAAEGESTTCEWADGATLVNELYFEDFAQEEAESIGAIDRNANWPLNCIDWEEAARQLKQDYTSIDYDGEEYWVRMC